MSIYGLVILVIVFALLISCVSWICYRLSRISANESLAVIYVKEEKGGKGRGRERRGGGWWWGSSKNKNKRAKEEATATAGTEEEEGEEEEEEGEGTTYEEIEIRPPPRRDFYCTETDTED